MLDVNKVITVAVSEVGTTEKKDNINKYAAFFDKEAPEFYNSKKQGAAWCDIFVDWCFCQAYGLNTGRKMLYQPLKSCGAGCSFSYGYYKEHNAVGSEPKKGAQIFFKNKSGKITHTGIVIDVDKTHVYTVEGNKDNAVKECKYPIKSTKIFGYGYPDFDIDQTEKPAEKPADKPEKKFDVIIIAKSGLRVRKEPNTNCKTLYVLPYESEITVSDYNNEWYKTKYGFIYKKWTEVKG